MLEREKLTECLCLALKLASWSGIYRSSVRKRGTDDGIVEISNRSNFLRERERERDMNFMEDRRVEKQSFDGK